MAWMLGRCGACDAWRAIAVPTLNRSSSSPAVLAKGSHAQLLRKSRMSTARVEHAHPERSASDEEFIFEQISAFKHRTCMR